MEWNFKLPKGSLDFGERKVKMARERPDDPFGDESWGPGAESSASEMPDSNAGERPRFIKPHNVGAVGTTGTLELVRVTSETSDYSDVILLIKFKGQDFRLGLRTFSDEYQSLLGRFGKKRSDWHGTLRFKVVDNGGKPYVAVRAQSLSKP